MRSSNYFVFEFLFIGLLNKKNRFCLALSSISVNKDNLFLFKTDCIAVILSDTKLQERDNCEDTKPSLKDRFVGRNRELQLCHIHRWLGHMGQSFLKERV